MREWRARCFGFSSGAAAAILFGGCCAALLKAEQEENQSVEGTIAPDSREQASTPALVNEITAARQAMAGELEKLVKDGASPEEIARWHEDNATRLTALREKMKTLAARHEPVRQPYVREVLIPAGASTTEETFFMERARLQNDRIRVENQTLNESSQMRREALEAWDAQNAAALAAQAVRARQISNKVKSAAGLQTPPLQIPQDATPELREFLMLRHAVLKEQIEMTAELQTLPHAEREQAMEKWRASKLNRVQSMQDAASRLSGQQEDSE